MTTSTLYRHVVSTLEHAGRKTQYAADANEPDPRYLGYGVRSPQMRKIIAQFRPAFNAIGTNEKIALAKRLVESGYGEQKTVALHLLDQAVECFTPDKFRLVDHLVRHLHGWSKIDAFTGSFLRSLLENYPDEMLELVALWNDDDQLWLRRASVVLFTRKVARSGEHTRVALKLCDRLKSDPEALVLKGVGWCLKDLMHADKTRVLHYVSDLRREGVSSTITLYALRDITGKERQLAMAN